MRKLKVPGRIIGRKVSEFSPLHRYFIPASGTNKTGYAYRFQDDTDLPISNIDHDGNLIDPIILSANSIRTFWNSPWREDTRLYHPQMTPYSEDADNGDIDRYGRDRAGMLVRPSIPDEGYVRKLIVECLLNYAVGILADGSVMPNGRCWCWQSRWSDN